MLAALHCCAVLSIAPSVPPASLPLPSASVQDTTPQGATHLASGPHTSGRKSVPKWQLGLLGFAVLISVALIAVGAIIPKIVENTIKTTVQDTVLLDADAMKADSQAKFYNSSSPMDFYLYSCTNLYQVLTSAAGDVLPNFKEVGPFNFIRYQYKYDVVYNADRTMFSYKQLTTFQVADAATAALLDTPIIGPNALHFGMGQQILQMGIAAQTGKVTSFFPGNMLSDQQTHVGAMAGLLLPLVLNLFTNSSNILLSGMRVQSFVFYIGYAKGTADTLAALAPALGITWASAKAGWAQGIPVLSAYDNTTWAGFELSPPNTLASTNFVSIADKLMDEANTLTSLASPMGVARWGAILGEQVKGITRAQSAAQQAMVEALGLNEAGGVPDDFDLIVAWIARFQSKLVPLTTTPNPYYLSYQKACMTAIGLQVQKVSATGGSTTQATFNNSADFEPKTWEELGALQFGSGFMVALALNQTAFMESGEGKSFRALSPGVITGFDAPMNFADRATSTWGGMEPPEYFAGLRYYVDHCVLPATTEAYAADTRGLWDTDFNPVANLHLLFVKDAANPAQRTTFIPLTIDQSSKLMATLTDATKTGGLFAGLNIMVQAYATTYLAKLTDGQVQAIAEAYGASGAALAGAPFIPDAAKYAGVLSASGVTNDNFYAIYTYLASYLLNELAGPLTLLDPTTGLAPQNTGLFTQRTAREMLFGYTSRFGTAFMVPGIAGVETDWSQHAQRIVADRKAEQGKDIVQYTGKGDFERIGQFVKYAGVAEYKSWCDLFDPARVGKCATAEGRAVYDEDLYTSPLLITGSGDGTTQGPLHEDDDDVVPIYTLYVDEAKRSLPLVYNATHSSIKDIKMRRYRVGTDPLVGDNFYRNKTQLRFDNDQQVPNGFTSVQSVMGGIPLLLGLPRFGPMVDADFDAGVTCTGADGVPGKRCQDTYVDADHGTWLDVEPITGLTMNGHKRLQANFRTSRAELYTDLTGASQGINYHYNNMFKGARWASNPHMVLPYYWADLHDQLKDDDAEDFYDAKDKMAAGREMGDIVHIAGITVGAVGVFASVGALIFLMARK